MSRMILVFVCWVFIVKACVARITIGGIDKIIDPKLVDATVQILRSCYENRSTPVGLVGKASGTIGKALWSRDLVPVSMIDGDPKISVDDSPVDSINSYKLEVIVISASSEMSLINNFRRIKASVWWNHMAAFMIIDRSPFNSDCSDTVELLSIAWEMGILNAKLMCDHRTKGRLIYTFNPFTNQAPAPWRFNGTHKALKNHPWTLFVRDYVDDPEICHELDFEKANDLGGYEIRVSVGDSVHRRRTKSEGICFDPIASDTCSTVFPASNATLKLITHGFADALGHVDKGHAYGILGEVASGLADVGFNSRAITDLSNLTASYPHHQSELYSVVQYSGYRSQLSKISSVVDVESRFGLFVVLLVTVGFFKYLVRVPLGVASLDTLGLFLNSSIPKLPKKIPTRIYLGSLLVFTVTMNGIFQGRLASLLTNPQPIRSVNAMKDLVKHDYKIYGFPGYDVYFSNPDLGGRFRAVKGDICTKYALKDPDAVCVGQTRVLVDEAAKYKLQLSHKPLAFTHVVLPIRSNWPLEQRLNTLLQRSVSAGLRRHLNNKALYRSRLQIKLQDDEYKNEGVKVLTLEQLSFAFVVLGIGLGLATISFVVELGLGRRPSRIARTLKRSVRRNK